MALTAGQKVKHPSVEGVITVKCKAGLGAIALSNGYSRSYDLNNQTVCFFTVNGKRKESRFPTNELTEA